MAEDWLVVIGGVDELLTEEVEELTETLLVELTVEVGVELVVLVAK